MKKKKSKSSTSKKSKDDAPDAAAADAGEAAAPEAAPETTAEPVDPASDKPADEEKPEEEKPKEDDKVDDKADDKSGDKSDSTSPSATPSLAQQSKLRSTSFRAGSISVSGTLSPGPFSPDGETAPDIYRKHVAKIEELEKENKRLAKEAGDSEKRWKKAEEELADLREAEGSAAAKPSSSEDLDKLVSGLRPLYYLRMR